MSIAKTVGANIVLLREARKLSRAEIAKRARIGESQLRKMEAGIRNGSIPTLVAIARVLGTTPADLLTRR